MKEPRPPSEAEQRLKAEVGELMIRDRALLVQRQPFVGHLAMHLDLVPIIDSRMTTACTDGTRMFMDAEFYRRMDEEERLGSKTSKNCIKLTLFPAFLFEISR